MIDRQPISDQVEGFVTAIGGRALLSAVALDEGELTARGALTLRYGITFLGKPHLSIVPSLVVADYGELLKGEEAWDFLMTSAHLYPRADVCGFRSDGADEMTAVKQLDFDAPYDVFVYRDSQGHQPLAKLAGLIAAEGASYPERLLRHLPRYESLNAWRRIA